MNNAKIERALQSAGIPFSYEQDGVRVHLEDNMSLPPQTAKTLGEAGLEFHSVMQDRSAAHVVFKESGMGGFL